jgi:two-component system alkaline phosphatase synthesis response regulator PhoP
VKRILIIEDDADLLEGLKDNLELEGYEVMTARDGEEGLNAIARNLPDAIILDVMLPKLGGLDLCRTLRGRGVQTPVLLLTARSQERDKILGLESGADDYVTKPFSIHEVIARLRVMIRRSAPALQRPGLYRFGDVEVDFARQRVHKRRTEITLSSLEFEVLRYFVWRAGQIIPRDHLLNEVWGYHAFRTTRAVDNLVGRLRQKLEDDPHAPKHILTVYGVGYKFVE